MKCARTHNTFEVDAKITFNQGLTVSWSGKPLGKMNLDPVDVVGDVGATLDLSANFEVADVSHLTDFTKVLLTEETFDWDIAADNLTGAHNASNHSKLRIANGFSLQ